MRRFSDQAAAHAVGSTRSRTADRTPQHEAVAARPVVVAVDATIQEPNDVFADTSARDPGRRILAEQRVDRTEIDGTKPATQACRQMSHRYNVAKPPFDNKALRLAARYAINRALINNQVLRGSQATIYGLCLKRTRFRSPA